MALIDKIRGRSSSKPKPAEVGAAHTGRDILQELETIPPLSKEDSDVFLKIVAENRAGEGWDGRDLR